MKRVTLFTACLVAFAFCPVVSTAGELKAGDPAPNFTLPASDGRTYTLADFKGQRAVVLAWFPKAFTHGCLRCPRHAGHGQSVDVLYR